MYTIHVPTEGKLGKSVISGSQWWEESTCNGSVAYSVFQFD
jgi:hypothetical protein